MGFMNFIDGSKTYFAGSAAMLTGAGMVLNGFLNQDWDQINAGWTMFLGGLAVIGVGHKLDKQS